MARSFIQTICLLTQTGCNHADDSHKVVRLSCYTCSCINLETCWKLCSVSQLCPMPSCTHSITCTQKRTLLGGLLLSSTPVLFTFHCPPIKVETLIFEQQFSSYLILIIKTFWTVKQTSICLSLI